MTREGVFGLIAGVLMLTACSHTAGVMPGGAGQAQVAFSVVVPRGATTGARSHMSTTSTASTQSIRITVTSPTGGTSSTVANCTSSPCVVNFDAPAGTDTFTITLYDGPNGNGNVLSSGSLAQSLTSGTTNTVDVSFDGQIAQMSLTATPATLPGGAAGTAVLSVIAKDAGGNTIISPAYATGVTLSDSDTSGATSLSSTSLSGSGQTSTLSYTGASIASVTITASATGVSPASATISFVTASPSPGATATPPSSSITLAPSSLSFLGISPTDAQSVTVSESGYSGSFAVSSTCASIATISGSGNAFTVTPVGAGTCTATFADSNGNSAVLPIVVTVTTGGGQ